VEESQIVQLWQELARARTLQDVLLRVFRRRMPGPLPPEVVAAVERQTEGDTLSRWLDLALDPAASLDQLRAALGVMPDSSSFV
jgi:hypothetical protein